MDNPDYPGYLRGEDLQAEGLWAEFRMEIEEVIPPNTIKAANGRPIPKPIIAFKGAVKRFVVGETAERLIKAQLGTKPATWPGQSLTLYPAVGDWFGVKKAIAVRVRVPEGVPRPWVSAANLGEDITGRPVGAAV